MKNGSIAEIRKKFHKTHELIATSYHEAGHVIYGLLYHLKITSVIVFEDKKSKRIAGLTHYDSRSLKDIDDSKLFHYFLNAEICFRYAGLSAEKYYFKMISGSENLPMFLKEGSSDDTNVAGKLIAEYQIGEPGKDRALLKKQLNKHTSTILINYWSDVSLISHSLFKKKELSYNDLYFLLTSRSKNKKFWKSQFKAIDKLYSIEALDNADLRLIVGL